ncbi:AbrB/MazE/SpoVT family DNA-binding domain-containing protein [Benzoatithermus flavus]|uniref:AbrB/MazE/SpoVT family DNA-binding domain-containing protein n=1 Tax=Benzoatithermus flavus TaxID=3108223 RepID=A0ABU8XWL1_9PROT
MRGLRVKVAENGRLSLPIEIRRQLGLEKGGTVVLKVENGEVRMTTLEETVRRIQERMRKLTQGKNISVADFLAWKKEQAALERREDAGPAESDR